MCIATKIKSVRPMFSAFEILKHSDLKKNWGYFYKLGLIDGEYYMYVLFQAFKKYVASFKL